MEKEYCTKNLITYLGNKRKLLPKLDEIVIELKQKLGKERVVMFDGFSGSGCVARMFKRHSTELYVNDMELYSFIINECFLADKNLKINEWVDRLNNMEHKTKGLISKYYSPENDKDIKEGERVFYTNENAMIIDSMSKEIRTNVPKELQNNLMALLLIKASIHTNTSGIFKGFHKKDSIGNFGGKNNTALKRICGRIVLDYPVFSSYETEKTVIYNDDIMNILDKLPKIDITYYDPPYNQHPYGSNYFMLNLIATNEMKNIPTGVSGILDWKRSDFNYKKTALDSIKLLLKNTNSHYIIVSYNNEGIVSEEEWIELLKDFKYEKREVEYNTYRGSRNMKNRNNKVQEIFWIINKGFDLKK